MNIDRRFCLLMYEFQDRLNDVIRLFQQMDPFKTEAIMCTEILKVVTKQTCITKECDRNYQKQTSHSHVK